MSTDVREERLTDLRDRTCDAALWAFLRPTPVPVGIPSPAGAV